MELIYKPFSVQNALVDFPEARSILGSDYLQILAVSIGRPAQIWLCQKALLFLRTSTRGDLAFLKVMRHSVKLFPILQRRAIGMLSDVIHMNATTTYQSLHLAAWLHVQLGIIWCPFGSGLYVAHLILIT